MRYLLQKPSTADATPPPELWIALHGATGTAEQGLELFGPAAKAQNALLLAPQASRPLGDGFAWSFARDHGAVMQIVETLAADYACARQPIGLCGFSMGCAMGLWLLASYPDRFRFFAAVAMGSAFEPWELDDGGADKGGLRRAAKTTPVFLSVDRHDPAGCAPYVEANLAQLRELGFRVQTDTPDEGQHWVTDRVTQHLVAWTRTI